MQAKKVAKQRRKVVQLDSDVDSMSLDDNSEDSDFDGAPKKVRLPGLSQTTRPPCLSREITALPTPASWLQHATDMPWCRSKRFYPTEQH